MAKKNIIHHKNIPKQTRRVHYEDSSGEGGRDHDYGQAKIYTENIRKLKVEFNKDFYGSGSDEKSLEDEYSS